MYGPSIEPRLGSFQQTASAISTVVMAAAVFPEAQRKVQEELDLVIAPGKGALFRLFMAIY